MAKLFLSLCLLFATTSLAAQSDFLGSWNAECNQDCCCPKGPVTVLPSTSQQGALDVSAELDGGGNCFGQKKVSGIFALTSEKTADYQLSIGPIRTTFTITVSPDGSQALLTIPLLHGCPIRMSKAGKPTEPVRQPIPQPSAQGPLANTPLPYWVPQGQEGIWPQGWGVRQQAAQAQAQSGLSSGTWQQQQSVQSQYSNPLMSPQDQWGQQWSQAATVQQQQGFGPRLPFSGSGPIGISGGGSGPLSGAFRVIGDLATSTINRMATGIEGMAASGPPSQIVVNQQRRRVSF